MLRHSSYDVPEPLLPSASTLLYRTQKKIYEILQYVQLKLHIDSRLCMARHSNECSSKHHEPLSKNFISFFRGHYNAQNDT